MSFGGYLVYLPQHLLQLECDWFGGETDGDLGIAGTRRICARDLLTF